MKDTRLKLSIHPSLVRLHTTEDDAYAWTFAPQKSHLFDKNLSDHSIGSYKELCENVGTTFKAVPVSMATVAQGDVDAVSTSPVRISD